MHEQEFAESESVSPTTRLRARSQRWQALGGTLGAAVLTLFALGCPNGAELDNAGQYQSNIAGTGTTAGSGTTAGTSSGGSAAGGTGSGASCETTCVQAIFKTSCNACHNATGHLGKLDLESANVGSRLKDQASNHAEIQSTSPMMCPTGDKLIDSANPAESWLLKKVAGEVTCGDRMPIGAPLTADQISCVQTFVNCVAGGSAPAGAGGTAASGGGTGGTGTAGAATAGTAGTGGT